MQKYDISASSHKEVLGCQIKAVVGLSWLTAKYPPSCSLPPPSPPSPMEHKEKIGRERSWARIKTGMILANCCYGQKRQLKRKYI